MDANTVSVKILSMHMLRSSVPLEISQNITLSDQRQLLHSSRRYGNFGIRVPPPCRWPGYKMRVEVIMGPAKTLIDSVTSAS
ncbi:hypothetical protein M0802_012064 [Mischocyttarus mexicanus]|nr:hypothetical protein M0802_012064 [Mischocyttarus mexicanus]